ncbi:MAG: nickel-dependent lactate racemase [Deltaproteobacteria bacterium]|nr:nickel-dependent lactate racemase [Deltaproteobacteria bacterium]
MELRLKYGHGERQLVLPDSAKVSILHPAHRMVLPDLKKALRQTLDNSMNPEILAKCWKANSVAIAVPDQTRSLPVNQVLPLLLGILLTKGLKIIPQNVTVIIGGGLHPPMSIEEIHRWIPPESFMGCKVIAHDARNSPMMRFGRTKRGTPVEINEVFGKADLKIVLGQVDPHQFVGFTGGAKGVTVGCASAAMIEHNHGLMFREGATVGRISGNPVREDINESGQCIGVDLAVNLLMDPNKDPVGLWAGTPDEVLEEASRSCAQVYGVAIEEPFDIVVASCGGYPKDISLYQAQKGLNLASQALKPGGKILLLAQCGLGVGDEVYYDYVCRFPDAGAALSHFQDTGFKMGAHKSFLFGRTITHFEVVVDSDLDSDTLARCHLVAGDAQQTINHWTTEVHGQPRVAVVPNANTTFLYTKDV